jgi:uncharacterized Zn finger protein
MTYLRNGSVAHLGIATGRIEAFVSGSSLYAVSVSVKLLPTARWNQLQSSCAGEVGSLLELLQGKVSSAAMMALTHSKDAMMPQGADLAPTCSCPDGAYVCKHIAAVLDGVGARLDAKPELRFTLRSVDVNELIVEAGRRVARQVKSPQAIETSDEGLADLFGIDLDGSVSAPASKPAVPEKQGRAKRSVKKKTAAPSGASAQEKSMVPSREYATSELRKLGYTPAAVKKMLTEGALTPVSFGWYRFVTA